MLTHSNRPINLKHQAASPTAQGPRGPKGAEQVVFHLEPHSTIHAFTPSRHLLRAHDESDVKLGDGGNCSELYKSRLPDLLSLF